MVTVPCASGCVCENDFIPYLAMRHRICTKVTKLLWLTMYSIIVGGIAPDGVSDTVDGNTNPCNI